MNEAEYLLKNYELWLSYQPNSIIVLLFIRNNS